MTTFDWFSFGLGFMVAFTPSFVVLALLLLRAKTRDDFQ